MDRRKWFVLLAVDMAMALGALDTTVVGTAMPTVVASLGGLSLFSWVFSIYLLTSTASLPIFGRLSDLFGRRNMFLLAVWIFTAAFLLVERRALDPILPLGLLGSRTFVTTTGCLFLSGLAMFGATAFIPLFVQAVLGGTAIQAGTVLTPISLSWTMGSGIGGRLLNRLGYRTLAIAAMFCLTTGYLLFTQLGMGSPLGHAAGSGVILGLGMGLITVTTVVAVQTTTPMGQIGVVSSLPFFFRNIGATIGVAIMGTILNAHVSGSGASPISMIGGEGAFRTMPTILRGELAHGIRAAFFFGLGAVALGIPVSLMVPDLSPIHPATHTETGTAQSPASPGELS